MPTQTKSPLANLTLSSIILYLRRRTFLTVAIVSWSVMALLAVAVVLPQIRLISAHTENLGVEEKKLAELQARSRFLLTLDTTVLASQQTMLQQVLPSQKPVTPLISSVERLAENAGVALLGYELSPGTVATQGAEVSTGKAIIKSIVPEVGSLPLKLDVQGAFGQMNTFFKSLDLLVPLVNVKGIDFTVLSQTKGAAPESVQYKASVELDSLYALPESLKLTPNPVLVAFTNNEQLLIASLSSMVSSQPALPGSAFQPQTATSGGVLRQSIFSF